MPEGLKKRTRFFTESATLSIFSLALLIGIGKGFYHWRTINAKEINSRITKREIYILVTFCELLIFSKNYVIHKILKYP